MHHELTDDVFRGHSIIDVTVGGHRWAQELAGTTPVTEVRDLGPADRPLNRATFHLDASYFAEGAALPSDTASLQPYWARGERVVDTGQLTIRDCRKLAHPDHSSPL